MSYFRWYGEEVSYTDQFDIDVSSDGGESSVPVERVYDDDRTWRKISVDLAGLITLTDNVKLRFRACDLDAGSLIEAAIDDFSVETFTPLPTDAPDGITPTFGSALAQNQPNPFNPVTMIRFTLSNPADALLTIYDATSRQVRALVDRRLAAGSHQVLWDGTDDSGRSVGSGVFFYRLTAGVFEQSRRMTILK